MECAIDDTRTKQRLIHILVQEIVCDLDDATNEAVSLIHWTGGRHTELRVSRVRTGRYPADLGAGSPAPAQACGHCRIASSPCRSTGCAATSAMARLDHRSACAELREASFGIRRKICTPPRATAR